MIMDNYGSVFLNSNTLVNNAAANYSFPANTDLSGKLVAGWNEIRVQLLDVGGLTGINFNLTVSIDSASPMSLASPGKLIIYDGQSGTPSRANDSVTGSNSIATLPTASRTGFEFLGWYTAASGGTLVSAPYTPSGDVTLYAHWAQLYDVLYDEQGGTLVSDSVYRAGGSVTLPANPTKTGYNFDGWFDNAISGVKYGISFSPSGTGTINIYAHWSVIPVSSGSSSPPTRTITFGGNGVSGQNQIQTGIGNSVLPINTYRRPGYIFVGWNTAANGSGQRYAPGTDASLVLGDSLYAEWKVVPLKKLVAEFNGDSAEIKKSMSLLISKFTRAVPQDASITCTGSTSGLSVTNFDKRLARARALNVCKRALSFSPMLNFKIEITPSTSIQSSARHVWLEYK
jgi:uncharacterized repeat protein (TIGR02543 family)